MKRLWILVVLVVVAMGAALWWWLADPQGGLPVAEADGSARARPAPELGPVDPAAPEGVIVTARGKPFRLGAGHRVSLGEYRETVADPASSLLLDLLRVEVCAGEEDLAGVALPAAFGLGYPLRGGGFEYRTGASALVVEEPALSTRLAGETVQAGECRDGWVAFVLGVEGAHDRRAPASIVFDNTVYGFVPESSRARHAWALESDG